MVNLGTLEQEIKSLTEVMTLLDAATGESVEYLSERIAENDILIGILSQRQEELEEQLALKQDLLSGTCPDGEAMIGIDVEGSLLCESFIKGSLIKTIYRTGVHKVQGARGYEIDMGTLKCDNLIGGGAQVPRQVQRVRPYKYSAANYGAPAYSGYAYLNSSPWHPDFAQPGSEIYWKFWIDCLQLPEPWTVDVVGD